jgi:hypothetical protein
MGNGSPFTGRRKAIKVLVGTAAEARSAGADDTAEMEQGFFIHLIAAKEFGVITKVAQEPVQAPESTLAAVDATGKRLIQVGFWLQDAEAHSQKGFLGMPAVSSEFNAHQEEPVEIVDEFDRADALHSQRWVQSDPQVTRSAHPGARLTRRTLRC